MGPITKAREEIGLRGPINPEIDNRIEVVWGRKYIERIPLDSIITLSQIRDGENPEIERLAESIENGDLINQIDVARMDGEALSGYIKFVNKLWGSEFDVSEFQPDDDGKYHLCIAGHSRTAALRLIAARHPDIYNLVECKIHDTPSPVEIISMQLNENIYREPSKERQAMAIVETYYFGLEQGFWCNREEFAKLNRGNFSRNAMNGALNFAKLPPEIRIFVTIGDLPYAVAPELGKIIEHLRTFYSRKILGEKRGYKNLAEDEMQLVDATVTTWLGHTVAHIRNEGMSSNKATEHVKGYLRHYKELNQAMDKGTALRFELKGSVQEMMSIYRSEQREYQKEFEMLGEGPLSVLGHVLRCHARLIEDPEQLIFEVGERIKSKVASIGGQAIKASGIDSGQKSFAVS